MVKVKVPATTANLGCGYDTLGVALNLYTIFEFEEIESGVEFVGFDLEFSNEENLVYVAFKKTLEKLNKNLIGVRISIKSDVPISRGLGSSSTCVVGGIYGAYSLSCTEINKEEIFNIATEIEGHPDNVSPAIFGNLSVSCTNENKKSLTAIYNVDERINFLALIPDFETSTKKAREVMPKNIALSDAIYSYSRIGIVIKALETYNLKLLKEAMDDKIHEPYRKNIINEYADVRNICESVDSVTFMISGSGSTLINIIKDEKNIPLIEEKLKKLKHNWRCVLLKVDKYGTVIE